MYEIGSVGEVSQTSLTAEYEVNGRGGGAAPAGPPVVGAILTLLINIHIWWLMSAHMEYKL